ncbi:hypothetical protein [Cryobacterium tagatosivorans]|uniref:Uncharacterized protein n=1 Tax=Cryobacterium tagatosivorans TaxID=1259199 RepID=A0A4R8UB49_9MICO|nr:hypothetical protein [Cryobacterium tagatosivorans]TFB47773.1 hypothetical protein E3O23_14285 [Cryobacterium tagatosivorans]
MKLVTTRTERQDHGPSRATQQRLDPLGALAAWPLAPIMAAITVGYAVLATILQADQIQSPLLAALAVVAMAAAGAALVAGALPARAPFEPGMHLLVVGLALAAALFEQASKWGHNSLIQDDFGQLGIGLLLLALAPYRPWRQIALSGIIASLVGGALALSQAAYLSIVVPSGVYAVVAMTVVLSPAAAGAAYSRRIVRSILAWQADARRAGAERSEETRGQVAQAVVDEQIATLRAGVIPFLTDVLERGAISPRDIERAGELAADVRRALVEQVDSTWLDSVVARERATLTERGLAPLLVVSDADRRATAFGPDQRAATAALIGAICGLRGFDPGSLVVQVTGSERRGLGRLPYRAIPARYKELVDPRPRAPHVDTVTVQAGVDLHARRLRRLLRPYLGVLRVLFVRVRVSVRHPLVTVIFDDERVHTDPDLAENGPPQ